MLCIDDAMIHVALLFYEEKRSASNATATVSCRLNLINDYVENDRSRSLSIYNVEEGIQSKGRCRRQASSLSPLLLLHVGIPTCNRAYLLFDQPSKK